MKTTSHRTGGITAGLAMTALAVISLATSASAQVSNWYDSFESYAGGSSLIGQGGWSQLLGAPPGSNELVTVQSDPSIAVAGDKYLRIQTQPGVAQSVTHIQNILTGTDGTIRWYANAQQNLGSSLGVTLAGNLGGAVIARVNFGCCGSFNYSSNATQIASATYATNVWYGFNVHMNGSAGTYNLDIFQVSNGSNLVNVTGLPYVTPGVISDFYFIGFNTDAANGVFFVDNVSAVPEPGALGLLGIAGLLLRRRRK
jgi:MYXO-CTERM domain-containing protein